MIAIFKLISSGNTILCITMCVHASLCVLRVLLLVVVVAAAAAGVVVVTVVVVVVVVVV